MRVAVIGALAESLVNFRGEMLRSMAAQGHEVLALAPEDDARVRKTLESMGVGYKAVHLQRTGTSPVRDATTIMSLARTLRTFGADAVLSYAAKPVIYGSIAARIAGVPLRAAMITGVGSALGSGAGWRRRGLSSLLRRLYDVALREVHVVFFQNPDDERYFRSAGLIRERHCVVRINGSGVDLRRFSLMPLPPDPITFLMVGRLIRDKGVSEFVEAARRVRESRPDVRFLLLGAMDSNPSAISGRELEDWRREGVVEYLETVSDVRPSLARAHVMVLPSYGEGMPRSVLEAMAMGRVVLTTDVPGCRETVEPGRNGLLVPPRDAAALADGMLELIRQPGRLESMGRRSRAIAEQRFDVHSVNRAILDAMGLHEGHLSRPPTMGRIDG